MAGVDAFGTLAQNLLLATPAALVSGLHLSFAFAIVLICIAISLPVCVTGWGKGPTSNNGIWKKR